MIWYFTCRSHSSLAVWFLTSISATMKGLEYCLSQLDGKLVHHGLLPNLWQVSMTIWKYRNMLIGEKRQCEIMSCQITNLRGAQNAEQLGLHFSGVYSWWLLYSTVDNGLIYIWTLHWYYDMINLLINLFTGWRTLKVLRIVRLLEEQKSWKGFQYIWWMKSFASVDLTTSKSWELWGMGRFFSVGNTLEWSREMPLWSCCQMGEWET